MASVAALIVVAGAGLAVFYLIYFPKPVNAANILSALIALIVVVFTALATLFRWSRSKDESHKGATSNTAAIIPRQLPSAISNFTGRKAYLDDLNSYFSGSRKGRSANTVIYAISGLGGAGKTSLIVHWAHKVRRHFIDGQLFIDLHGFDPIADPMPATEALETFIRAMGVSGEKVPATLGERSALFRSLTVDKRLLILLDNAESADQIRPLLPGSPGCLVLITSRHDLSGLVAREGARRLHVNPLTMQEGEAMVSSIVGSERTTQESSSVTEICRLCGGLPLALRLVAERVERLQSARLSDFVQELRDTRDRLNLMKVPHDPRANVGTVFSWSYAALSPEPARIFRLISLNPGKDISTAALAALCSADNPQLLLWLDTLREASLIEAQQTDRWSMHDLVQEYGRVRMTEEAPDEKDPGLKRLGAWYLCATSAAVDVIAPYRERLPTSLPESPAPIPTFVTTADARAWLEEERRNLVELIRFTIKEGLEAVSWTLAHTLWRFLYTADYIKLGIDLNQEALQAARRAKDREGEMVLLNALGLAFQRVAEYAKALPLHESALTIARNVGDPNGEVRALNDIGNISLRLGKERKAIEHYRAAIAVAKASYNLAGEASATQNIGLSLARLGEYDEAIRYSQSALPMLKAVGHTYGVATTLSDLGFIYTRIGNYDEALTLINEAMALVRDLGSQGGECEMLNRLGETQIAMGHYEAGLRSHERAAQISRETGDRFEEGVAAAGLAHAYKMLGRTREAVMSGNEACEIFRGLDVPELKNVESLLEQLTKD